MTTSAPQSNGGDPNPDPLFMLSSEDSLVSPSARRVDAWRKRINAGSGSPWRGSSMPSRHPGSSPRTCPVCADADLTLFSATLIGLDIEPAPEASRLVQWVPHMCVDDCSFWPTPLASDADKGGLRPWSCRKRVDGGHTPHLNEALGGPTNPLWLEWFMGFPAGWTELGPSETP